MVISYFKKKTVANGAEKPREYNHWIGGGGGPKVVIILWACGGKSSGENLWGIIMRGSELTKISDNQKKSKKKMKPGGPLSRTGIVIPNHHQGKKGDTCPKENRKHHWNAISHKKRGQRGRAKSVRVE